MRSKIKRATLNTSLFTEHDNTKENKLSILMSKGLTLADAQSYLQKKHDMLKIEQSKEWHKLTPTKVRINAWADLISHTRVEASPESTNMASLAIWNICLGLRKKRPCCKWIEYAECCLQEIDIPVGYDSSCLASIVFKIEIENNNVKTRASNFIKNRH